MKKFIFSLLGVFSSFYFENLASATEELSIPKSIAINPNEKIFFTVTAIGVQIYECKNNNSQNEWVYKEPRATLYRDGHIIGTHYAGPTWEYKDKSLIVGKVLSSYKEDSFKNSVPWLKLEVVSQKNAGILTAVTAVQRLYTNGGMLTGVCKKVGELYEQPYKAEYVFITHK